MISEINPPAWARLRGAARAFRSARILAAILTGGFQGLLCATGQIQPAPAGPAVPVPAPPPVASARFPRADWGLAVMLRTSEIPYVSKTRSASTLIPMFFYEGDRLFLRGLDGGLHVLKDEDTEFNAVVRTRFFDIPEEFQNAIQGDTGFFGVQWRQQTERAWLQGEFMADDQGRWQINGSVGKAFAWRKLVVIPSLSLSHISSDYNNHYYGLGPLSGPFAGKAGSAWELSPRVEARYHLFSDLHLVGSAGYTWFSDGIRHLPTIGQSGAAEFSLGFGFFQQQEANQYLGHPMGGAGTGEELAARPYVRVAHGWASLSSIGEILMGQSERDPYDNRLTSVFYGHPLTDRLFGAPLSIYLTPGLIWHQSSAVQSSSLECVLALKAYYTVRWPIRWRIGVAEGFSWIDQVTYVERTELEDKGYRPSQLMNFLDVSLDLNVGELVRSRRLEAWWLGYSVHHRSSIFETASQFGRIKGGSNYNSLYLQRDF